MRKMPTNNFLYITCIISCIYTKLYIHMLQIQQILSFELEYKKCLCLYNRARKSQFQFQFTYVYYCIICYITIFVLCIHIIYDGYKLQYERGSFPIIFPTTTTKERKLNNQFQCWNEINNFSHHHRFNLFWFL